MISLIINSYMLEFAMVLTFLFVGQDTYLDGDADVVRPCPPTEFRTEGDWTWTDSERRYMRATGLDRCRVKYSHRHCPSRVTKYGFNAYRMRCKELP